MLLNVIETGASDRVAVLLHGMMGSAESWWRVADVLVDRGYRVLSLDLPGHGHSPRDPELSVAKAAASVVETVRAFAGAPPTVAIGHSYGGRVLAMAAAELGAERAVYVDSPFESEPPTTPPTVEERELEFEQWEAARSSRTAERMRREKPHYGERDIDNEARAADRFDSWTAVAVANSPDAPAYPSRGDLVVRPVPSDYISDELAAELRGKGVTVRDIPGAAHSVWYSSFDEFMQSLDGWI